MQTYKDRKMCMGSEHSDKKIKKIRFSYQPSSMATHLVSYKKRMGKVPANDKAHSLLKAVDALCFWLPQVKVSLVRSPEIEGISRTPASVFLSGL